MAGFAVWHAPALPQFDHRSDSESVTIQCGMPYGTGPGIAITTYDPSLIIIEQPPGPMDRGGYSSRGVVNLATGVILPFLTGPSLPQNHHVTDSALRCENQLIPALAFDLLPQAQVVVSADLLTHAIAVVAWQIQLFHIRLARADSPMTAKGE
jgi:hypothetical protein